jgi:hypothetical protein
MPEDYNRTEVLRNRVQRKMRTQDPFTNRTSDK